MLSINSALRSCLTNQEEKFEKEGLIGHKIVEIWAMKG
jgi:hypothetical protein